MFNQNSIMDIDIFPEKFADNDFNLYSKNEQELQSIAAAQGLVDMFQPQISKHDLISLLSKKKKKVSSSTKRTVWDTYIGREVGQHPCLICQEKNITQLEFQCGYDGIEGGWFSSIDTKIDKYLPICNTCDKNKGTKTFKEYLHSIGKTRMQTLSEKMKLAMDNCVLDPEIVKSRHLLKCTDSDLCRIIVTNSILWGQFIHLGEKIRGLSGTYGSMLGSTNQKIKISLWEKLIILSI